MPRSGCRAHKTRLVIPRAHDCCTILLGSKQRFQEHFGDNPSRPFGSVGYLERGSYFVRTDLEDGQIQYGDPFAALVEQYGEDNARYIWESMHPADLEERTIRSSSSTFRKRQNRARNSNFGRRPQRKARSACTWKAA